MDAENMDCNLLSSFLFDRLGIIDRTNDLKKDWKGFEKPVKKDLLLKQWKEQCILKHLQFKVLMPTFGCGMEWLKKSPDGDSHRHGEFREYCSKQIGEQQTVHDVRICVLYKIIRF